MSSVILIAVWLRSYAWFVVTTHCSTARVRWNLSSLYLFVYILLLYWHFLQLYRPHGIFPMGNSGCLPREIQLGQSRATQPTVHASVFQCFHNPPNSDMDYRILNVRTDVNACDCTRGCPDTERESALKVDSRRKVPCGTVESNLRRRRARPMLY